MVYAGYMAQVRSHCPLINKFQVQFLTYRRIVIQQNIFVWFTIYRNWVFVSFVLALSCAVFSGEPQIRRGLLIVSVFLYVIQSNFIHYTSLACLSLVMGELSRERININHNEAVPRQENLQQFKYSKYIKISFTVFS